MTNQPSKAKRPWVAFTPTSAEDLNRNKGQIRCGDQGWCCCSLWVGTNNKPVGTNRNLGTEAGMTGGLNTKAELLLRVKFRRVHPQLRRAVGLVCPRHQRLPH